MSLYYDCAEPVMRAAGIAAAVSAVKNGELVVLPTDTVYGIGCDAFNPQAVRALLAAKHRGRDMPLGVLISSWQGLDGLVLCVPPLARKFVEAFWPGALSIIISHAPSLAWDLGDARGTVMVRMPAHPVALELLAQIGPMAVSSANISGKSPATMIETAQDQFENLVSVYLNGGPSDHAEVSTIIDISDAAVSAPAGFRILRQGVISLNEIAEVAACDVELLV